MINAIFIDTWGWLTLNDSGERRYKEVANLYQILIAERTPIYTSTFVLDETFTLFFKRLNSFQAKQAMLQLSEAFFTEQFKLIQIDEFRFAQTQMLRLKYLDKPQISFTDLTSMLIIAVFSRMRGNIILERLTVQDCNTPHSCDYRYMQEFNIYRILTEDAHFTQVGLGFQLEPNSF